MWHAGTASAEKAGRRLFTREEDTLIRAYVGGLPTNAKGDKVHNWTGTREMLLAHGFDRTPGSIKTRYTYNIGPNAEANQLILAYQRIVRTAKKRKMEGA